MKAINFITIWDLPYSECNKYYDFLNIKNRTIGEFQKVLNKQFDLTEIEFLFDIELEFSTIIVDDTFDVYHFYNSYDKNDYIEVQIVQIHFDVIFNDKPDIRFFINDHGPSYSLPLTYDHFITECQAKNFKLYFKKEFYELLNV